MISEAINTIQELAKAASFPRAIYSEREPKDVYYLADKDGEITRVVAEAAPLRATAQSLSSLVSWLTATGGDSDGPVSVPEVWYDRTAVVGVRDRDSRRDTVRMPLVYTPAFQTVQTLGQSARELAEFIRLLKIDLYDVIASDFLPMVRRVVFKTQATMTGRVDPQKASIGRTLESQLDMDIVLPDYIDLSCHVYTLFDHLETIRCSLDVDLEKQRFKLTPLPMEAEKAIQGTLDAMCRQLTSLAADGGVSVYYGSPNLPA